MKNDKTIIFTDGASKGNPGPGGWGAVLVCAGEVVEIGGSEKKTTNNRMELKAILEGLRLAGSCGAGEIEVYSDSSYSLNGITKWMKNWQRNGWQTKTKSEVLNRDLWEEVSFEVNKFKKISWKYLGGHIGIPGNERADEIASSFADGNGAHLYRGGLSDYEIDILNFEHDQQKLSERKGSRARSGAKAFSYLSMVGGVISRHATWAECEARVKGVGGALYRKALSADEEKLIVEDWQKKNKNAR